MVTQTRTYDAAGNLASQADALGRTVSYTYDARNRLVKTAYGDGTTETVTYEIFREITRAVRQFESARLLVIASPKVVARITEEETGAVAELEEFIGKSISFQSDAQYLQEQYDVVLL